jgi:23S rRNA pseudouridine2605 synthase
LKLRLQSYLSKAGIASRRTSEKIIAEGRVKINGQTVDKLGVKVDPDSDKIEVDGKKILLHHDNIYIVLNKPAGVVTTSKDPFGRPTVLDLVKGIKARIYPVGRLDKDTEGLLILTNDGDLTYKLTHPKNEIKKTYIVEVKGTLTPKKVRALKEGVVLDDGITAPAKIKPLNTSKNNTTLKIVIHEGRKRQIRRMCEAVGLSVVYLKRTHIEKFSLGNLKPGCWRYLTNREINYLKNL